MSACLEIAPSPTPPHPLCGVVCCMAVIGVIVLIELSGAKLKVKLRENAFDLSWEGVQNTGFRVVKIEL